MKNLWIDEFNTRCYVDVPKHKRVDLKPYVCGVAVYTPLGSFASYTKRITLSLDVPRQDTSRWESDDPDFKAIYDCLYNPAAMISSVQFKCRFKAPFENEYDAYLREIKMGETVYLTKGKASLRLIDLVWHVSYVI